MCKVQSRYMYPDWNITHPCTHIHVHVDCQVYKIIHVKLSSSKGLNQGLLNITTDAKLQEPLHVGIRA